MSDSINESRATEDRADAAAPNTDSRQSLMSLESVRVVRAGHGANCSSIGSVIDTLFATAAIGSAIFVGIAAALRSESVRVVGAERAASDGDTHDEGRPADRNAQSEKEQRK